MTFEWDEQKRQRNLRVHAIDFLRAALLFDGREVVTAASAPAG